MSSTSEIARFYENRNVFITGSTGFLGSVLLEKLLRATNVATVYLLVRDLKGKTSEERVKELLKTQLFTNLTQTKPGFYQRIVCLSGDISEPMLGLSTADQAKLNNVEIVFHVAATVRLDENLKKSYQINVKGTEEILGLCGKMHQLKSFVHVSTAYSNCHLREIDEIFYPPPPNAELIETMLETMSEEETSKLTKKIIGDWPNTYSFTKALAEDLVRGLKDELPVGVFRPSIVTSTSEEPIPGWIDNFYGPTGVFAAASLGLLHVVRCDGNCVADLIPVDMCAAALISCAWDVANLNENSVVAEQPALIDVVAKQPVYNYVSSAQNPITWSEATALMRLYSNRFPSQNAVWTVKLSPVHSFLGYNFRDLVYHALPAYLCDVVLFVTFQKPRYIDKYRKIRKFTGAISNFATKQWIFRNDNVRRLWDTMSESDKNKFYFNMATVNWLDYFKNYVRGIRKYLLGEEEDSLGEAVKRRWRLECLHTFVKMVINYFVVCFGLNVFKFVMWAVRLAVC